MHKKMNLAGQKFLKLTVLKRLPNNKRGEKVWLCQCECGNEATVITNKLTSGWTSSCGCSRKKAIKHGYVMDGKWHPLYRVYQGMKIRCYQPSSDRYHVYGGRGIAVCDEWFNDPAKFVRWAKKNGWKKGLQIDRIDNDGNYSPENCQIISKIENMRKDRVMNMEAVTAIRYAYHVLKKPTKKIKEIYSTIHPRAIKGIIYNEAWREVA